MAASNSPYNESPNFRHKQNYYRSIRKQRNIKSQQQSSPKNLQPLDNHEIIFPAESNISVDGRIKIDVLNQDNPMNSYGDEYNHGDLDHLDINGDDDCFSGEYDEEFDLDDLDLLADDEDYIHEESCYMEYRILKSGRKQILMTPLLDFNRREFYEGFLEMNDYGYASLIINTLLYPQGQHPREVQNLTKFVRHLIFIANPQLVVREYLSATLISRRKEKLDELCEFMVSAMVKKAKYEISLQDDPLF